VFAPNKKKILITVIIIALALNTFTFITAYPQTLKPLSSSFAADFSAYYIGEWRFFHNPTQIYEAGSYLPGDYVIEPSPQSFMYTPSFLLFFAPFLALNYQNAFNAFDILQLFSVFALALFVYKIVKDKNLILGCVAAVVVLLLPIPYSISLDPAAFFQGYYWGYALANAHIIQTSLAGGALYFGFTKRPWASAFLLAVASFDPRVTLVALPLMVWYNRQKLLKFALGFVGFIALLNLPFFFYYDVGFTFLQKRALGHIAVQMYAYDWVPICAVLALTIVEAVTVISAKKWFNFPKLQRPMRVHNKGVANNQQTPLL
jgi:hypothetical protein